ncbi:MAG: glycosyltransferase family 39 protein [Geitlerinemataceae cyanobacterium]
MKPRLPFARLSKWLAQLSDNLWVRLRKFGKVGDNFGVTFPDRFSPGFWAIAAMIIVGYFAFIHNLGAIGLIDETEPKFAEAARQMLVRNDWLTPYFNEEPRFDKPPLVYWLMAIGYQVLGVNEWAARLPSALAALGLMGLLFYTLHRSSSSATGLRGTLGETRISETGEPWRSLYGQNSTEKRLLDPWVCAFLGAAIFALNPYSLVWGRIGVSDMLLTGCVGSALLAFFWGYVTRSQVWYLAFYVLTALAVLAKGPVGFVLPAIGIGIFLLYLGEFGQVVREMRLGWGLIIVAAITLPWYVVVTAANGDAFVNSFFGYHNIERFTRVVNGHGAPWYFYFAIVFLLFAPWSAYLPISIARLRFWQRSFWQSQPREDRLGLFSLCWFVGVFGFFSISVTKLPSYLLPLIPAAAILVALQLTSDFCLPVPNPQFSRLKSVCRGLNVGMFLLLAIAFFTLPAWLGYDPAAPDLDEVLPKTGLAVVAAIVWLGATVAGEWLLWGKQGRWMWSVNVVAFFAFLILALHPMYLVLDRQRQFPLRQLAALIPQVRQPGEEVVMIDLSKTSLVFYSQQPIVFRIRPESAVGYIQESVPKAPEIDTVLILGQERKIGKMGLKSSQYRTLGKVRAYQLVRVEKQLVTGNNKR